MNILVVDDELPALGALKKVLSQVRPEAVVKAFDKPSEAYSCAQKMVFDVAFLDIEMGGMDGLELARRLKGQNPRINLIFVTAHSQYAVDAFSLHASGYLTKPVTRRKVEQELIDLRVPTLTKKQGALLTVRCFGNFAVFCGEEPVRFERQKTLEFFAFLVDRAGAPVSLGEICAILWEGAVDKKNYLRVLKRDMVATLEKYGAKEVLLHSHNQYSVRTELLNCDLYNLWEDPAAIRAFNGEYMEQYSWSENRKAAILQELRR